MVRKEVFNRLASISNDEWEDIIIKLNSYAHFIMHGRYIPNNFTAQDFAQEAITKLYSGEREWDFEKKPSPLIHLMGIVKSLVNSKTKSKHTIVMDFSHADENFIENIDDPFYSSVEKIDGMIDVNQLFDEIEESIKGDDDLEELVLYLGDYKSEDFISYLSETRYFAREEMAKAIKWDDNRLDNAIKRLRRKNSDILNRKNPN